MSGQRVVHTPSVEAIAEGCRIISQQVCQLMDRESLQEDGPWTLVYDFQESPLGEMPQDSLAIQMAMLVRVVVGRSVTPGDGDAVVLSELPGLRSVASVVHQGPYELLPHAYTALAQWVEGNDYCVVGPCREIYLQGPEDPVTEIQFPVEQRTAIR